MSNKNDETEDGHDSPIIFLNSLEPASPVSVITTKPPKYTNHTNHQFSSSLKTVKESNDEYHNFPLPHTIEYIENGSRVHTPNNNNNNNNETTRPHSSSEHTKPVIIVERRTFEEIDKSLNDGNQVDSSAQKCSKLFQGKNHLTISCIIRIILIFLNIFCLMLMIQLHPSKSQSYNTNLENSLYAFNSINILFSIFVIGFAIINFPYKTINLMERYYLQKSIKILIFVVDFCLAGIFFGLFILCSITESLVSGNASSFADFNVGVFGATGALGFIIFVFLLIDAIIFSIHFYKIYLILPS